MGKKEINNFVPQHPFVPFNCCNFDNPANILEIIFLKIIPTATFHITVKRWNSLPQFVVKSEHWETGQIIWKSPHNWHFWFSMSFNYKSQWIRKVFCGIISRACPVLTHFTQHSLQAAIRDKILGSVDF